MSLIKNYVKQELPQQIQSFGDNLNKLQSYTTASNISGEAPIQTLDCLAVRIISLADQAGEANKGIALIGSVMNAVEQLLPHCRSSNGNRGHNKGGSVLCKSSTQIVVGILRVAKETALNAPDLKSATRKIDSLFSATLGMSQAQFKQFKETPAAKTLFGKSAQSNAGNPKGGRQALTL